MLLSQLFEAQRPPMGSWYLMSATRDIFNKNKIKVSDVSSEWKSGTLYVADFRKGYHSEPKTVFLFSAGGDMDAKVGDERDGYNSSSFSKLGTFTIKNIVHIKGGKTEDVKLDAKNDEGMNISAPLYVFK